MKKWHPSLETNLNMLWSIPIWVRCPDFNLGLLNAEELSVISSLIDNPIESDLSTATRKRISYARCLTEINADSSFPIEVPIALYNGEVIFQPVTYEWIPPRCESCVYFGHYKTQCPFKKAWKEKVVVFKTVETNNFTNITELSDEAPFAKDNI